MGGETSLLSLTLDFILFIIYSLKQGSMSRPEFNFHSVFLGCRFRSADKYMGA